MATSSFMKVLELNKEAAEELIKMEEEGFSVNKIPNLEVKMIDEPEKIKKIMKKYAGKECDR